MIRRAIRKARKAIQKIQTSQQLDLHVTLLGHEESEVDVDAFRRGPAPLAIDDDGNELQIGDLVQAMCPSSPSPIIAFRTVLIDWDTYGETVEPFLAVDCLVQWSADSDTLDTCEWDLPRDLFRSGGAQ